VTPERRIELGEVCLAVAEAGAGGRPLLLLHGFTGAKEDFADWLEPLAVAGWHVVAPDLRGHGSSAKPAREDAYSIDRFAEDVLGLADALGWDRFTLLGHSMGGMIAQEVALRVPRRLDALILMDTSSGPVGIDPAMLEAALHVVRSRGMDALADLLVGRPGPLDTPASRRVLAERPGFAEESERKLRACSPAMYAAMATEITGRADGLSRLADLEVPTLVLVGEQDEPFLEPSRRLRDTIPGARLVVIPDAGHSPQFEAPEAWWAALTTFLRELGDAA
jgi:pimeloyl-ACP methyl ester carboxylesterase